MYNFELRPFGRQLLWNNLSNWDGESDSFTPACEILDEEKSFSISLDIPGLRKDEIDIEVKDNYLTISGERKVSRNEKESVLRSERRFGKFSRVFSLPQNLKTDAIEAHYENGVLELRLPKEEKSRPKKIQITDWPSRRDDVVAS